MGKTHFFSVTLYLNWYRIPHASHALARVRRYVKGHILEHVTDSKREGAADVGLSLSFSDLSV